MTNQELAEKLYRMNTEDWTVYREQIIAALRRPEPNPVLGECEECGHTIVTPLKLFPERQQSSDQVLEAARAWKKAGDAMALFRNSPDFDHVLTQDDREKLKENFRLAVDALHSVLAAAEAEGHHE